VGIHAFVPFQRWFGEKPSGASTLTGFCYYNTMEVI
jgi:hypothetical protein